MVARLIYLTLLSLAPFVARAQSLPDLLMAQDFAAQVKSVDEFIQRFNGTESHPAVPDSVDARMYNLVALFDRDMPRANEPDSVFERNIMDFIGYVVQNDVKIRLTDADMYAEVETEATVLDKDLELTLILQSQTYGDEQTRWAIVGAKGLVEAGLIDTITFYGISPVEHEIYFMGVGDIFGKTNNSRLMGYRGKSTRVDELSVLLAWGMTDNVLISQTKRLTLHCLEVPGYVFTIETQNRKGNNAGWLISNFMRLKNKEKYIDKLLGK